MQHGPSTPLTYLESCKTCLFCIPVLIRKSFLIFPIIYLRSDLHIDLVNPLIFADSCPRWHNYSLWGLLFQFHSLLVSWLLNFIEQRCVLAFFQNLWHSKLLYYFQISHAQTSLLVNCAGGSKGVQLHGWSNKGHKWAIRFWQVWGSWYPSIQCWRLWIG